MAHKDSTYFWILKPDLNTNQRTKKKHEEGERERRWRWKGGGGLTPRSTGYISSRCGAVEACSPSHHCLNTPLFPLFSVFNVPCFLLVFFHSFTLPASLLSFNLFDLIYMTLIWQIEKLCTFCLSLFPFSMHMSLFLCFLVVWWG